MRREGTRNILAALLATDVADWQIGPGSRKKAIAVGYTRFDKSKSGRKVLKTLLVDRMAKRFRQMVLEEQEDGAWILAHSEDVDLCVKRKPKKGRASR